MTLTMLLLTAPPLLALLLTLTDPARTGPAAATRPAATRPALTRPDRALTPRGRRPAGCPASAPTGPRAGRGATRRRWVDGRRRHSAGPVTPALTLSQFVSAERRMSQ